ncbi:MAG: helix-turn-helix domain-containing protein [Sedimentisphaeraceae bacterium JB056]
MAMKDRQIIEALESRGVFLTTFSNSSTFARGKGAEKYLRMVYINSGKGFCVIDGKEYFVTSGNALFLLEGQKISIYNNPNRSIFAYSIVYNRDRCYEVVDEEMLRTVFSNQEPLVMPGMYLHQLVRIIRGFLVEQNWDYPYKDFIIKNGALTILAQVYRVRKHEHDVINADEVSARTRVENVLKYIEQHYYDRFTLEEVSHMARMSSRHFSTLLNDITGKTFVNYLNTIRVENACELLEETDMAVSSIAFHVGFEELSSFYRAFKKRFDIPPLQFRKSREKIKVCN